MDDDTSPPIDNRTSLTQHLIAVMSGMGKLTIDEIHTALRIRLGKNSLPFGMEADIKTQLRRHSVGGVKCNGAYDLFSKDEHGYWSCKTATVDWPVDRDEEDGT